MDKLSKAANLVKTFIIYMDTYGPGLEDMTSLENIWEDVREELKADYKSGGWEFVDFDWYYNRLTGNAGRRT